MADKKLDSFTKSLNNSLCFLDNPLIRWGLIGLLVAYCTISSPTMPMNMLLSNNIFIKLLFILFIVYVSIKDKTIAILLLIVFVMTMQSTSMHDMARVTRGERTTYELMDGPPDNPTDDPDTDNKNTPSISQTVSSSPSSSQSPSLLTQVDTNLLLGGHTGSNNPNPTEQIPPVESFFSGNMPMEGPVAFNDRADCIIKNNGRTGQNVNDLRGQCTGVGTWQNEFNAQGMNFPFGNESGVNVGSPF